MLTRFEHFERKNEFTQKRWVYLENAETPATNQENLAEKTPVELMEMLRQEGMDVERKKVLIGDLIDKIEQSNIPEEQKKSIREEVSQVLTTMETSDNALEIHRLRFELAGTIQTESMSDIAEWWEKIKLVSPTKNAIIASFESLKNMNWSEMLNGGLDQLMEYGGMIIAFISGGRLRSRIPAGGQETTNTPQSSNDVETPVSETPEGAKEEISEQTPGLRNIQDLTVSGREMAFKTIVDGKTIEWRINPDGRRLLRKQEDGNIRTPEGNFREVTEEPSLSFLTEYLSSHYADLMEITNNVKERGEASGVLSTRILVGLIKLQQLEDQKVSERIDVLTSLKQNFSPQEQKQLILNTSANDPQAILNTIREKQNT